MKRRLYFDHNASTPVDPRVLDRFEATERASGANPDSLHGSGRSARGVLESARELLATRFGVEPEQVLFVSGGTEANNLAVLRAGNLEHPALCAPLEHASVYEPASVLRGRAELPIDEHGYVRWVPPNGTVGLVCAVHGQSEVGTLQDLEAAHELARSMGAPLHVDAAQSAGRVEIEGLTSLADTVSLTGHKLGGLRGCGVLLGRGVSNLTALFAGGGQEFGLRPGTPSPALADSIAFAVSLALDEREQRAAAMRAAREAFEDTVLGALNDVTLRTPKDASLPNTTMVEFGWVDGRSLLPAFDIAGVEASAGSACSSGSPTPPRVLLAMGLHERAAQCCTRFSFAHTTSVDDAREGALRVVEVVERLRRDS